MSSTNFRLETFRPWNPFQDKPQHLQDTPDVCRYPSPVSITVTTPPSGPNDIASKPSKWPSYDTRNPLPPRPPVEVCLDSLPRSELQAPSLEPDSPELLVTADQHPLALNCEGIAQPRDLFVGENIDPAILEDHDQIGTEQTRESENIPGVAWCQGSSEADPSYPSQHGVRGDQSQPNEQNMNARKRLPRGKRSGKVAKRGSKPQFIRRNHPPFSTVRSHFMAMSVEDRLQFLSWLFEGALSHCVSVSLSTDAVSALDCSPDAVAVTTDSGDHLNPVAGSTDAQNNVSTRKGLPWSMEEIHRLVNLRDEQKLSWSEVIRQFTREFPGRTKGAIQVYWSTTLKEKRAFLPFLSD